MDPIRLPRPKCARDGCENLSYLSRGHLSDPFCSARCCNLHHGRSPGDNRRASPEQKAKTINAVFRYLDRKEPFDMNQPLQMCPAPQCSNPVPDGRKFCSQKCSGRAMGHAPKSEQWYRAMAERSKRNKLHREMVNAGAAKTEPVASASEPVARNTTPPPIPPVPFCEPVASGGDSPAQHPTGRAAGRPVGGVVRRESAGSICEGEGGMSTVQAIKITKPPAPYILFNDPFAAAAKVLGGLTAEALFETPLEVQAAVRALVQYAKRRVS